MIEKEEINEIKEKNFSFKVDKDILLNGIRIVERATAQKGLQPVLSNILFKSVDNKTLELTATDFDMSIITKIEAQVDIMGEFTLPAKLLLDVVSKIKEGIINFELIKNVMCITNKKSKFEILGISANEFPKVEKLSEENYLEIDFSPFIKGIKEAGFAAATYESNNNLFSGVVCDIKKNVLEIASTDGNRLARSRKIIRNSEEKEEKLIIPSKLLQEILKLSYFIDQESINLYYEKNKIMIKTENIIILSNLMVGQYPQYNQLIPQSFPKEAKINVSKFLNSIERVSPLIDDKTNILKLEFSNNMLKLTANAPEEGMSEDEIDIIYNSEDIKIAFNYRYLQDCLKNIDSENLIFCMNTSQSATVIKPDNEEDFINLIMPVQIR